MIQMIWISYQSFYFLYHDMLNHNILIFDSKTLKYMYQCEGEISSHYIGVEMIDSCVCTVDIYFYNNLLLAGIQKDTL